MKIAFYAPLKSPRSPVPSGDRLIGRLLMRALSMAGHEVHLAAQLRTYDRHGDRYRQQRLAAIGTKMARRLVRRYQIGHPPDIWFTYHLYHKAPDALGPQVSKALNIPYVVAECSHAPKQTGGPWADGHRAVVAAVAQADRVIGLNRADEACIRPLLAEEARYVTLKPFLDAAPFLAAGQRREECRHRLRRHHDLDPETPLLLSVAMMRSGDKVQSYGLLARALDQLCDLNWHLLIAGDGPEAAVVGEAFAALDRAGRISWLGRQAPESLPELYAAADVFVWPAVKESPGMCFLEAQAAGVPVIGSTGGGVPDVVEHERTGLLARHLDGDDFAASLRMMLERLPRQAMGRAAAGHVRRHHDLPAASRALDRILRALI